MVVCLALFSALIAAPVISPARIAIIVITTNSSTRVKADFEGLMVRAAGQVDPGRRRLFLEEAERVMLADHPAIPIYFYVSKHMVSPRVGGWGDNVLDYHYSQHLSLKAAE